MSAPAGRLAGRVALVTGGGRGFGRTIVEAFGAEGIEAFTPEYRARRIQELPVRHLGALADVAYCAVFLAAESSNYLTGRCSSPTAAG